MKNEKMKNEDILKASRTLAEISASKTPMDRKLRFLLAKNVKALQDTVDSIIAAKTTDELAEGAEYEKARQTIFIKYSEGGTIEGTDNVNNYNQDQMELNEKYEEYLDNKRKADLEMIDLLKEKTEIYMYPIPGSILPDDLDFDILPIMDFIDMDNEDGD